MRKYFGWLMFCGAAMLNPTFASDPTYRTGVLGAAGIGLSYSAVADTTGLYSDDTENFGVSASAKLGYYLTPYFSLYGHREYMVSGAPRNNGALSHSYGMLGLGGSIYLGQSNPITLDFSYGIADIGAGVKLFGLHEKSDGTGIHFGTSVVINRWYRLGFSVLNIYFEDPEDTFEYTDFLTITGRLEIFLN